MESDIAIAHKSIVVCAGTVDLVSCARLLEAMRSRLADGIAILLLMKSAEPAANDMSTMGFTVKNSKVPDVQCAIFDGHIVWYGGINFLGKTRADDNSIRLADPLVASELLDALSIG